jgi:hypothetical protein
VFRCPNCGSLVYGSARCGGSLVCPNCNARLRVRASGRVSPFVLFFLFVWLLAVPFSWGFGFFWLFIILCCLPATRRRVEVDRTNASTAPQTSPNRSQQAGSISNPIRQNRISQKQVFAESQRTLKYCIYCGAAISAPDWRFCQNCGASLSREATEVPYQIERNVVSAEDHSGKCMVCGLRLDDGQALAYCAHCGSGAHKVHLLEWLHVKNYCPVCGQHLNEQDIE